MKKILYLIIFLTFAFVLSSCKDFWHPEVKTYATIIVVKIGSYGCTNLVLYDTGGNEYKFEKSLLSNDNTKTELKVPAGEYFLTAVPNYSGSSNHRKTIRSENFTVTEKTTKVIEYYQSKLDSATDAEFRIESTEPEQNATIIVRRTGSYDCSNLILHTVPAANEYQFNPVSLSSYTPQATLKVPAGTYYVTAIAESSNSKIIRSENFTVAEGATKIIYYYQSNTGSGTNAEFRME
jgi:hypothetical protein